MTTTATYSINCTDAEAPPAWAALCATLTPGAQDSGRCRYAVTTARPGALEAMLEADASVIEYEDTTPRTPCQCGAWSGEQCQGEVGAVAVVVEWMPAHLRGSHAAAGGRGIYPANGAVRARVTPECATRMVEYDGGWCEVISGAPAGATKSDVRSWEGAASYVCVYPDGDAEGAAEIYLAQLRAAEDGDE
jgi:hypothetical protein